MYKQTWVHVSQWEPGRYVHSASMQDSARLEPPTEEVFQHPALPLPRLPKKGHHVETLRSHRTVHPRRFIPRDVGPVTLRHS